MIFFGRFLPDCSFILLSSEIISLCRISSPEKEEKHWRASLGIMGVILATEAVVGVAEAAEGAGAVEGIASASEAGEAISSGTEAGAEAGSQAGEDAAGAAEAGGSALESVLQTLNQGLVKLEKMVTEYMVIDAVFKAAKKIVTALFSDPSAQVRAKKLEKLIKVLSQSSSHLKDLIDWLKAHSRDEVDIKNIAVTLQGVLSKFIPQLGAVSGD